jgi:hypothetical protein
VETAARCGYYLFRSLHLTVPFEVIQSGCILIQGNTANVLGNIIEFVPVMWKIIALSEICTVKCVSLYFTSEGQINQPSTIKEIYF